MPYLCFKWGNCSVPWDEANWKWSECRLVQEILTGIEGTQALPPWLRENYPQPPQDPYPEDRQRLREEEVPWDAYKEMKEKRRRFVELLAKVKGEPDYSSKRMLAENVKISVSDVKLVVKKVSGIDISILE